MSLGDAVAQRTVVAQRVESLLGEIRTYEAASRVLDGLKAAKAPSGRTRTDDAT